MNIKETIITLPKKEEMLERLLKVNKSKSMREDFYPFLLDHAEERRTVSGMVVWIMAAIDDYTQEMEPIVKTYVYKQMPEFIDALVDDKEEAQDLKSLIQEARRVEGG